MENKLIILADDDEDDRNIFREVLGMISRLIRLETVEDGSQLLEILSHKILIPDYIFLDLNMPCVTGHESLISIRNLPYLDETPVIIYSTSSWEEDIRSTWNNGANLYIKKPNTINKIEKMLRKVLSMNHEYFFPKPPWDHYYIHF